MAKPPKCKLVLVKALKRLSTRSGDAGWITVKQAKASTLEDGYSDGSTACFAAIKDEINQMSYDFPLVNPALYKRVRCWGSIISEPLSNKDTV